MRTEEGKTISSRNATKHGCCSEATLIMKGEDIADYKALELVWFKAYKPKDEAEWHLVQEMVNADWFSQRAVRVLAEVEAQLFETSPLDWTDERHAKLARFQRYQTARANAVIKARKAVEDYRKNRVNEVMKAEKHQIFKEKNEEEMSVEDCVREMEETADLRRRMKEVKYIEPL